MAGWAAFRNSVGTRTIAVTKFIRENSTKFILQSKRPLLANVIQKVIGRASLQSIAGAFLSSQP